MSKVTTEDALPGTPDASQEAERRISIVNSGKGRWERLWPVIACGAGLFSDGYLNGVRSSPPNCSQSTTCALSSIVA
ncbi:hypothetical protein BDY21DRAFT_355244 [Lineolata rhizophorae]|uniref:Uncharacterized protein n=1 Tax=Lineolata rhizophorae TaxID=578093 RepID=A0A6A6NQ29_9PEZI|nr:hypothetical protein BDY21DRAFT_355244 [Lineolata rhizophorae]